MKARSSLILLSSVIVMLFLAIPTASAVTTLRHSVSIGMAVPEPHPSLGSTSPSPSASPSPSPSPSSSSYQIQCTYIIVDCLGGGAGWVWNQAEKFANGAVGDGESMVIQPFVDSLNNGLKSLIQDGLTFWLNQSSINLSDTGALKLNGVFLMVGIMIATFMLMWSGIQTIIQRRGTPLLQAFEGLFKMAIMSTIAVSLVEAALAASDALTQWIETVAFNPTDSNSLTNTIISSVILSDGSSTALVLLCSLVVFVIMLVELVLLFIRQAAIPIQTLLIPVAAAGQVGGRGSRQWLVRLWSMIVTVVLYKPMAMMIIAVGFAEANSGTSIVDVIRGIVTLMLAIIAMPALLKLFTPIVDSAMSGGATGVGVMSALAASALSSRLSGGGGEDSVPATATQQAAFMQSFGPSGGSHSDSSSSSVTQQAQNVGQTMGGSAGTDSGSTSESGITIHSKPLTVASSNTVGQPQEETA